MTFSFFAHTGDIGVALEAPSLDLLMADGAAALTETITTRASVQLRERWPIQLVATAPDLLLVDFLNEILYRFDARRLLVADAVVRVAERADEWHLHGDLRGEPFDPARHAIKVLVKAVTYHALEVARDDQGWRGRVIFDI